MNYSTSAAGNIRVELLGADGNALNGYAAADCDEVIGDEISRVITWRGNSNLSAFAGKPIRVRFIMKDADLYSLQFSDGI